MIIIEATKTISRTKRVKKTRSELSKVVLAVLFIASVIMLVQVAQQIITTMQLRSSLAETRAEFAEIQAENDSLISQQSKLDDPDYYRVYAKGSSLLSQQDEYIFILPDGE